MNQSNQSFYPHAELSHPGMRGKNNEDRYSVSTFYHSEDNPVPSILAVLSDGIGGHRAGEVAAQMVVTHITDLVEKSDASQPVETLRSAIESASRKVYQESQADFQQEGMGATCACAWIIKDRLYTANVGDSRIYLLRQDAIKQISTDHTWVQEALDLGLLKPEQVRGHPNAHIIRRFVGSMQVPEVDTRLRFPDASSGALNVQGGQGLKLLPGDIVLLCSDGLTDLVQDYEILRQFQQQPLEKAVSRLVDMANARGGHDNITLVAVRMPALDNEPVKAVKPARKLAFTCLVVVLVGLLVGLLVFGGLNLWDKVRVIPETPTVVQSSHKATIQFSTQETKMGVYPSETIQPLLPATATLTTTATATAQKPTVTRTPVP